MTKKNPANSFKNILNNNSLNNIEDLKQKVVAVADTESENDTIDQVGEGNVVPTELMKPLKKPASSDKHLQFIESILIKVDRSEGKAVINVSKKTHSRLKTLSFLINTNIEDLTNSILSDYFEKNMSNIEILKKKSEF